MPMAAKLDDLDRGLVRAQGLFIPQQEFLAALGREKDRAHSAWLSRLRQGSSVCPDFALVRNLREPA